MEEEFGPENFVVVVRGLLDEAREVVDFSRFREGFCSLGSFGWMGETSFEWGKGMTFWTQGWCIVLPSDKLVKVEVVNRWLG